MKRIKFVFVLLLMLGIIPSCVDSDYDLNEVDTDELLVGDNWTIPFGKGELLSEDIVKIERIPSQNLRIKEDGTYTIVYPVTLNLNSLKSFSPLAGTRQTASVRINLNGLTDLFPDNFVLSLLDPRIKAVSTISKGEADCTLTLQSFRNEKPLATVSQDIRFSATSPNAWISPLASAEAGYTYYQNSNVPDLTKVVPEYILLSVSAVPAQALLLTTLNFELELPFQPGADFEASSTERLEDIFDDEFANRFFSSGSVTIYGTLENELPFDMDLGLVFVDANNSPLAINLPLQEINGTNKQISFTIEEKDISKMNQARHVDFNFQLTSATSTGSTALKTGQKISLDLKLTKKGGINIKDLSTND